MYREDVIAHFGGVRATQRALGLRSHAAVRNWGEVVPFLRACHIQLVTRGRLRVVWELYPEEVGPGGARRAA